MDSYLMDQISKFCLHFGPWVGMAPQRLIDTGYSNYILFMLDDIQDDRSIVGVWREILTKEYGATPSMSEAETMWWLSKLSNTY